MPGFVGGASTRASSEGDQLGGASERRTSPLSWACRRDKVVPHAEVAQW